MRDVGDHDLSGTVLDGRYKVIEPIAEGAMGSVYRGERLKLGRAVAIKVMHQELPDELSSRQRFEREAKLMALLEHPNCVSVIDFGVHDDKPFLVMDLVRGTSLIDLLEKSGKLEIARASDIIRQVLSGLAHAHELGIVHRDIKPANIMISEKAGFGSQVRILDFGLARLTEGSTKLTTGIVVGTPNYMAPEQCKGSDVDARTDIYACGVMLFEMLTGRKPFIADDPIAVVRKHLMEAPPTLSAVEPNVDFGPLESIVARALAKKPEERFDSAVDMSKAVEAAAKAIAAPVFARAGPDTATPPASNQVATPSGWAVPQESGAPVTESQVIDALHPSGAAITPSQVLESAPIRAATPHAGMPDVPTGPAATPHAGMPNVSSAPTPMPHVPSGPTAGSPPNAPTAPDSSHGQAGGWIPPSGTSSSGPISDGAPNRSLGIPPTRPAQQVTEGRTLSNKQLAIGGGVFAVLVIIVIAIFASSGEEQDAAKKQLDEKPIVVPDEPTSDPIPAILDRGNKLIASDDPEAAVSLLTKARRTHPDNAQLALALGRAYFGKLWWSEGVKNFRDAIKLDPEVASDPEMLKAVLKGFLTTPDIDSRIADFMLDLGEPMKAYLKETADTHPNKQLRARATAMLRRFR